MDLCLMIEGQEGVAWPQWVAIAEACERYGIATLFRSDHYSGFHGGQDGALDAWATLAALAARTEELRLGTLVSPGTFRHPSVLAKNAVTVDHVSGGRIELGMGAGWHEAEHVQHGFEFHSAAWRVARFREQLEIVHRQLNEDEPFDFEGKYYTLRSSNPLPKPVQRPLPILVGGKRHKMLRVIARHADIWNFAGGPLESFQHKSAVLDEHCAAVGRDPATIEKSVLVSTANSAGPFELSDARRQIDACVIAEQLRGAIGRTIGKQNGDGFAGIRVAVAVAFSQQ